MSVHLEGRRLDALVGQKTVGTLILETVLLAFSIGPLLGECVEGSCTCKQCLHLKPQSVGRSEVRVIELNDTQDKDDDADLPTQLVAFEEEPVGDDAPRAETRAEVKEEEEGRAPQHNQSGGDEQVPQHERAIEEQELRDMQAAMIQACEQRKAAAYRDWEEWGLHHAPASSSCSRSLVAVQVRGGVRHGHGGFGTTQSMILYMDTAKRERIDLQISVDDPRVARGDDREPEPKGRGEDQGPGRLLDRDGVRSRLGQGVGTEQNDDKQNDDAT